MNGSFEMYYDISNSENFYFQCAPISLNEKEGICSCNADSIFSKKGLYTYREHESLLNNDIYNINFEGSTKEINYYGIDFVDTFFDGGNNYYVSNEGNTITLLLDFSNSEDKKFLSKIYPNKDSTSGLTNCKMIEIEANYSIIH